MDDPNRVLLRSDAPRIVGVATSPCVLALVPWAPCCFRPMFQAQHICQYMDLLFQKVLRNIVQRGNGPGEPMIGINDWTNGWNRIA